MSHRALLLASIAGLALPALAAAQVLNETEDNNTKPTANSVASVPGWGVAGSSVTGTTTGTSTTIAGLGSADYYLLQTAPAPLAIYRHRMTLTTNNAPSATLVGTLRGLNVPSTGVITPGSDSAIQTTVTSSTPPRFNQWYGFGRAEQMYYRVTGSTASTLPYTATLSTTTVLPIAGPANLSEGSLVISTVGQTTTDTDLWVYDALLNPLAGYGNDDESVAEGGGSASLQSMLTRTYAPGVYYLAISNFNVANNLASPATDDFTTGGVLDFANGVANSSATAGLSVNVSIGGTVVQATKDGAFDVVWIRFQVIPAPGSAGVLAMAGAALLRRRR